MNLNITIIAGNITHTPETRATEAGTKIASFTVATNRAYNDSDGNRQEEAEFHNVQAFGKLAEICGQYLVKGQQVLVEGRLQTRHWKTQNGQPRQRTEIIANKVEFGAQPGGLEKAAERPEGTPKTLSKQPAYPDEDIRPEDIPF